MAGLGVWLPVSCPFSGSQHTPSSFNRCNRIATSKGRDTERSASAGASRTGTAATFETKAPSTLGGGDDLRSESRLSNGIATTRGFGLWSGALVPARVVGLVTWRERLRFGRGRWGRSTLLHSSVTFSVCATTSASRNLLMVVEWVSLDSSKGFRQGKKEPPSRSMVS